MPQNPPVERIDLAEGLRPLTDVMRRIADATEPILLRAMPFADAPGMAEIAAEPNFASEAWDLPITNAYSYASILGYAAVDHLRALAKVMTDDPLPVWAALPLARASLDAASVAYWLSAPGIGAERRAQRGMALRLLNAREQLRAPAYIPDARENSRRIRAQVRASSAVLGWGQPSGRDQTPRVGTEEIPTPKHAIDALMRHGQPADFDALLGLSWWYYSGATHSAPWALMQSVEADEATSTGVEGLNSAPVKISGPTLVVAAAEAGRGVLNLADVAGALMGADVGALPDVSHALAEQVTSLLRQMDETMQAVREGRLTVDFTKATGP